MCWHESSLLEEAMPGRSSSGHPEELLRMRAENQIRLAVPPSGVGSG